MFGVIYLSVSIDLIWLCRVVSKRQKSCSSGRRTIWTRSFTRLWMRQRQLRDKSMPGIFRNCSCSNLLTEQSFVYSNICKCFTSSIISQVNLVPLSLLFLFLFLFCSVLPQSFHSFFFFSLFSIFPLLQLSNFTTFIVHNRHLQLRNCNNAYCDIF